MKNKQTGNVQEWIPFKYLKEKGIVVMDNYYLKIIKINPINYNLKSELEKEAILNSYKLFLKTCNFDIQILIQSKKEDLSTHIKKIEEQEFNEQNEKIMFLSKKYINFIQKINLEKQSLSKNFYIIIKNNSQKINLNEKAIEQDLSEKYFKIKECLARCGNSVIEIKDKKELREILNSFFNYKNYINSINVRRKENF